MTSISISSIYRTHVTTLSSGRSDLTLASRPQSYRTQDRAYSMRCDELEIMRRWCLILGAVQSAASIPALLQNNENAGGRWPSNHWSEGLGS